ncbi:MAG: ABC transporter, partial [Methanofollis sp.]|nr:ABC transporter [Methanofollis sp.]
MRLQTLKAIAGKEFRDHVRSRRFLALLAVILIISGMGMVSGTVMFQESLERYHDALTVVS